VDGCASTQNHAIERMSLSIAVKERKQRMLWTILVILVILWLLGFALKVGGGLIHLILVIAVILLIVQLITGRRV
jgi:hypothetical protein